jgi:hypothetical protein
VTSITETISDMESSGRMEDWLLELIVGDEDDMWCDGATKREGERDSEASYRQGGVGARTPCACSSQAYLVTWETLYQTRRSVFSRNKLCYVGNAVVHARECVFT